ncbi:MAG: hypothetical protein JW896_04325, partial [Deltaproteobacteria bacterium]|nr:hypothetical protein [Deltaproteobacteria bacterium]
EQAIAPLVRDLEALERLVANDLYALSLLPHKTAGSAMRRLTSHTLLVIRDKSKPLDLKEYIHIRWWILAA